MWPNDWIAMWWHIKRTENSACIAKMHFNIIYLESILRTRGLASRSRLQLQIPLRLICWAKISLFIQISRIPSIACKSELQSQWIAYSGQSDLRQINVWIGSICYQYTRGTSSIEGFDSRSRQCCRHGPIHSVYHTGPKFWSGYSIVRRLEGPHITDGCVDANLCWL